jgi:cobalt-zinc-cadmium resistance protein CzcA
VIVVENVFRHLGERQPKDYASRKAVIYDAAVQVGRPTLFSMLIIIVAHIPIFTLQRQEGRIFAPMAYTVVSALIGSLIFSLTLVPLLCLALLRKNLPTEDNRLVEFCRRLYRPVLRGALRRPLVVIACTLLALAGAGVVASRLGTEFLPVLNEGSLWLNITMPSSVSLTEAAVISRQITLQLQRVPEIRSVIAKSGRPEDGTDPKPISMAEDYIDIKPEAEWRTGLTRKALFDEIYADLATIPGIDVSIDQPIQDNVLESITQIDGQIVIKVFGEDGTVLREQAARVLAAVSPVPGVLRAFIDRAGEVPQLQITIDRERASRYGLNVADVEDVIETALGGTVATSIWEGDKRFGVSVRLPDADRQNLTAVRALLIDTPNGLRIPLDQVAELTVRGGAMNISREAGSRMSAISIFIQGRDMGGVVHDMQQRVGKLGMPAGYLVTWGGEFENQQRAMARLSVIVPISLLLIFVFLFHAFHSVRTALVILMNVPLAAMGGILALYLTGIPLSVSAAIGFIALFGQAVLNGVVMVSDIRERQAAGTPVRRAIEEGALVRLRTVLMTALLAMLGLLPMALSHEIGSEVQRPLAVVVIGGLFSATILTLLVLPVLYQLIEGAVRVADGPRGAGGALALEAEGGAS